MSTNQNPSFKDLPPHWYHNCYSLIDITVFRIILTSLEDIILSSILPIPTARVKYPSHHSEQGHYFDISDFKLHSALKHQSTIWCPDNVRNSFFSGKICEIRNISSLIHIRSRTSWSKQDRHRNSVFRKLTFTPNFKQHYENLLWKKSCIYVHI